MAGAGSAKGRGRVEYRGVTKPVWRRVGSPKVKDLGLFRLAAAPPGHNREESGIVRPDSS